MKSLPKGYSLPDGRFTTPDDFRKWRSPYQFDSEELDILQRQGIQPTWTRTLLLSTAQSPQDPLIIEIPGRAFKIAGYTTATEYSLSANTGIETTVTTAFVGVVVNKTNIGNPNDIIFVKNGGGYRGDFLKLALFWPTQASNSARITIYRYDGQPYMSGDVST